MKHTAPPGVFDLLPFDERESWRSSYLWQFVEQEIRSLASLYGFREIRTPVFEKTELFQRSVGETTDVVSKEMYTFEDKGGRLLSLKPEGTAPAIRAYIEHQLFQEGAGTQKLFYIAPMFRYERAQAGRYRQHHQFGVEAIGKASPEQDVEIIDLLSTLYRRLGIKNTTLYLNSIGSESARLAFREALIAYLQPQKEHLSPDSQKRLETNPLRILDSKDPRDRALAASAPSILDFLTSEDKAHFEAVQELLTAIGIPFQINPFLVRGLDYYNRTVFEIVAGELGAQNSIGGGGRYDGLIHTLGGPDLPAFGFGTGIERIIQTMINQEVVLPKKPHPFVYLAPMGEPAKEACFKILHALRANGIAAEMDFSGKKIAKALQAADQTNSTYCIVIGDHELASNQVEIKEMATGHKQTTTLETLIETFKHKSHS